MTDCTCMVVLLQILVQQMDVSVSDRNQGGLEQKGTALERNGSFRLDMGE